ncbi:MAG TPA: T9SS type A sorting domain-containing protein [Candidatus Kapabacteria bacterium]|nr:T9SS type A sorting domain-containing protein [Candidatus Kapabacteria bacterium]
MKYLIQFCIVLITFNYLWAQPTITNKMTPQIGEKYAYSYYDTVGVKQGNAGANVLWDFSTLVKLQGSEQTVNFEIVSPNTTPYANTFAGANYAYKQKDAENQTDSYVYYKSSSDRIERLGVGFAEGAEILSDWELVQKFPFTYEDSFSDAFKGTIDVVAEGQSFNLKRGGSIAITADAYGTLKLPSGTFSNVLRLKVIQSISDTLPPPIPGMSGGMMNTNTESYIWVSNDFKFAILSISQVQSEVIISGMPTNKVKAANVQVYDFTPPTTSTLSTPKILAPENGQSGLQIPVKLEWEASNLSKTTKNSDEIQESPLYTVYVADNEDFTDNDQLQIFEGLTATTIEVDNLVEGTKYYWKVKAYIGDTESEWSDINNFTTKLPKPQAAVLISPENGASNVAFNGLTLKWKSNNLVAATRIVLNGPSKIEEILNNESTYNISGLEPNSTYTWKVMFYNEEGDSSDWSDEWTFVTSPETSVDDNSGSNSFIIKNNILNNSISIDYTSQYFFNSTISIFDLNGNVTFNTNVEVKHGNNHFDINLPKISAGVYLLQMNTNNSILRKSIIIE